MAGLAEASLTAPLPARWWLRAVAVLLIVAMFGGIAWGLRTLIERPVGAKRQVARISILPDTPPPPPPPREEKRPEAPKEEPKQVVREEQLKPDLPKPANEPIKMEGAAGEGPSAFGAGTVSREYQGGPVTGASGAPGTAADRAQERFYANSAKQLLRDEIERHLKPGAGEVVATFAVWIETDGRIHKIELTPGTDPAVDTDLRSALDETSRQLRLPSPNGVIQPLRFRMTMRGAG
jgi:protein TonB